MQPFSKPDLELHLYRGRIYARGEPGDDRLQVRILPDMAGIKSPETDYLPRYSSLSKSMVFNGKAETDPGVGPEKADEVIIVATDDYTYGHILCLANLFYGISDDSVPATAWNFEKNRDYLKDRGLSEIEYKNIKVDNLVSSGDNSLIEFTDIKNGNKYIITGSGTCLAIEKGTVYIRCGTPANMLSEPNTNGGNPFSYIKMTPGTIEFNAKNFIVNADNIALGNGTGNLVTTHNATAYGMKGINFIPRTNIKA